MGSIGQAVPTAQPVRQYAYELPQKKHIKLSKKHNNKLFEGKGLNVDQIKEAINKVIVATEYYRKDRPMNTKDDADYELRRKQVDDAQKALDALSLISLTDAQKKIVGHYIRKKQPRRKRKVSGEAPGMGVPGAAPLRPYLDSIY
jgi:hypothetical protein